MQQGQHLLTTKPSLVAEQHGEQDGKGEFAARSDQVSEVLARLVLSAGAGELD